MRNTICTLAILTGLAGPAHAFCNMPYNPNGPVDPQTMQLYYQCEKLEKERMPTNYSDCANWAIYKSDDAYALEKCHRLEDY